MFGWLCLNPPHTHRQPPGSRLYSVWKLFRNPSLMIPPFVSPLSGLSSGFFSISLQLLTLLDMLFNLSPSFLWRPLPSYFTVCLWNRSPLWHFVYLFCLSKNPLKLFSCVCVCVFAHFLLIVCVCVCVSISHTQAVLQWNKSLHTLFILLKLYCYPYL